MVLSLKFELNESIIKQLIKRLFHTFLLLFRFESKYGCPISSKIIKLYFISNIIYTFTQRLKDYVKLCTIILNYPFKKSKYVINLKVFFFQERIFQERIFLGVSQISTYSVSRFNFFRSLSILPCLRLKKDVLLSGGLLSHWTYL